MTRRAFAVVASPVSCSFSVSENPASLDDSFGHAGTRPDLAGLLQIQDSGRVGFLDVGPFNSHGLLELGPLGGAQAVEVHLFALLDLSSREVNHFKVPISTGDRENGSPVIEEPLDDFVIKRLTVVLAAA